MLMYKSTKQTPTTEWFRAQKPAQTIFIIMSVKKSETDNPQDQMA